MKKVITFVGTSIFENYLERKEDKTFKIHLKGLRDKKLAEYKSESERVDYIKSALYRWISNPQESELLNISAEIKSITKIYETLKEKIEVHFLTTDTILSNVAFEVIKENWNKLPKPIKNDVAIHPENKEKAYIPNLQVKNREEFKDGLVKLIEKMEQISGGYWENIIINITAGYKAVIPYLTIFGQINKCLIYYIFEDTDALIYIPALPLDIKWEIFEKYWQDFDELESARGSMKKINEVRHEFLINCEPFVEKETIDNTCYVALNSLGKMFWESYKRRYFGYYTTEEVNEKIKNDGTLQGILKRKFSDPQMRNNKTEIKKEHNVYDDGDNPYRIFYFIEKDRIYIYNVFNDHKEYEDYLRKAPPPEQIRDNFQKRAKQYKIGKGG